MKKINLKELAGKINSETVLTIAGLVVTVAGTFISNANETNKQNKLKEEIKTDIMKELLEEKN